MDIKTIRQDFDDNNIKDATVFDVRSIITGNMAYERTILNSLAKNIMEFFEIGIQRHPFIFGTIGTGKTALINYLLGELRTEYEFETHYVNCHANNNSYRAMLKAINSEKRLTSDQAIEKFIKFYSTRKAILILDEIDMLKDDQLLYILSRTESLKTTLVLMLTNKPLFYNSLSQNVKSSLNFQMFTFPKYSAEELIKILRKRCEVGLWVYDEQALPFIATLNVRDFDGDARVGIKALAVLFKYRSESQHIHRREGELRDVMRVESVAIQRQLIQNLYVKQQEILYLTLTTPDSARLYERYNRFTRQPGISHSYFRQLVVELDKQDLVYIERARYGRSTKNFIRDKLTEENKELLKQIVENPQRTNQTTEVKKDEAVPLRDIS